MSSGPAFERVGSNLSKENEMPGTRVLVAYGSERGSTAGIALAIGDTLRRTGARSKGAGHAARQSSSSSSPKASTYRSTSASEAGTGTVGPAPGMASHTPRFAR